MGRITDSPARGNFVLVYIATCAVCQREERFQAAGAFLAQQAARRDGWRLWRGMWTCEECKEGKNG